MADEIFEVTLKKLTAGGDALGYLPDSRAVFVPFTLPDEQVKLRLVENKRRYARAQLLEILQPSPLRITPKCPHFAECGGCHYQHMSYQNQQETKLEILRDQFSRIAHITNPPLQPIQPSPQPWNYRNHIQFHLDPAGHLGFLAPGSKQVVPVTECHLPADPLNTVWPNLEFEADTGIDRFGLRLGNDNDILLSLTGKLPETPILDLESGVSVVHQYKGENLVLAGDDHIFLAVESSRGTPQRHFRVSAGSFFQVNTRMASALVDHILEHLPERIDTFLDVFCGVGLFSAFLAPRSSRVIGVEVSPSASDDFVHNLDEFDHIELYQAHAQQVLPSLMVNPDVILVDPPRAGLQPEVLDAILKLHPKTIVYVSCDPATLARDTSRLIKGDYLLDRITPFDLFPQTHHIESVSFFSLSE